VAAIMPILSFYLLTFSCSRSIFFFFFFLKAKDGIRVSSVTGVQTCALPICRAAGPATSTTEQSKRHVLAGRNPNVGKSCVAVRGDVHRYGHLRPATDARRQSGKGNATFHKWTDARHRDNLKKRRGPRERRRGIMAE